METHLAISISISLLFCMYPIVRSQSGPTFTASDIDRLRILALDKFDSFGNLDDAPSMKPLIGSLVRLVFHDCAGPLNMNGNIDDTLRICDGCIDFDLEDHNGLKQFAVEPVEQICQQFSHLINRADCWCALANIALEYASSLSQTAGTLPTLPYYTGRSQCELSPDAITLPTTTFPAPQMGWDPLADFFKDFFGFNLKESTAIMGAHTLGRAHESASGFHGKWTKDSFAFNNQFFIELLDKSSQWDQTQLQKSGFPQWTNEGRLSEEEELIMLNPDMSLIADLEELIPGTGQTYIDPETGIVSCRWEGFTLREGELICPREKSFDISLVYAKDNQRFLDDFVSVWNKLVTNNYDITSLETIMPNPFGGNGNTGTREPTLVRITREPTAAIGDSSFCCIAKKIPNWNGRCWRNLNENDCVDEVPGNRCIWDINNCREEQICLMRGELCSRNKECCSLRCRPDIQACR